MAVSHPQPGHDTPERQLTVDAAEIVGHFLDQARRSGASWTDIGKCMGAQCGGVDRDRAEADLARALEAITANLASPGAETPN